jgi:hypothetical protein
VWTKGGGTNSLKPPDSDCNRASNRRWATHRNGTAGLNEAFRLGRQIIVDSGGGPLALMMADLAGCLPTGHST